jgi:hypothetical protein
MTSQNGGGTNRNNYKSGAMVRLLIDDMDNDENGLERKIPAGTLGTITNIVSRRQWVTTTMSSSRTGVGLSFTQMSCLHTSNCSSGRLSRQAPFVEFVTDSGNAKTIRTHCAITESAARSWMKRLSKTGRTGYSTEWFEDLSRK